MPTKPDVYEMVHVAFSAEPGLARVAVDAVLDLHHEYRGHCYQCSRGVPTSSWPRGAVAFPCPSVRVILEVIDHA